MPLDKKVVAASLLPGILAGLLAALLGLLPPGEFLELKGYDLFHALRRPAPPPPEIVIVAIDEASFAEIGRQWPWPRSLHGRLVESLRSHGARVVVFDVLFAEPSPGPEDRLFAAAIRDSGNVILAADLETLDDPRVAAEMTVEPLDLFREGAATGLATVPVDRDGVVRQYPSLREDERSLAQEAVRLYAGKTARVPANAGISFLGPPGTFSTVSYYQALEPSRYLPDGIFRDRIVLVGRALKTHPEVQQAAPDLFATPFLFARMSRLMAGVEIHANMVLGLLTDRFVRRVDKGESLVLFLCLGLAAGLTQTRWRPLRSGILVLGLLGVYWGSAWTLFASRGLWLPTVLPLLCLFLPYGAMALRAYLQSERQRREIRKAFSCYLSPAILAEILRNPEDLKLGGRRVEATVLFSDLADFTKLAEKVSAEDVGRFLNRYFAEMAKIVFAHQGTIDKFIGDAIMAFWGAPLEDPEQAVHACRAALAMQERMQSLRQEMKREGLPELFMRVGINSGEVIVGNMGSAALFNYTVLGDAVNLASRLEGANKEFGTAILISAAVRERAVSGIRARPLGRISVKGRSAEVEVFELTGTLSE